ncbi:MAG TPA: hypothetical protein VF705_06075 [Longimicrobium sp.]
MSRLRFAPLLLLAALAACSPDVNLPDPPTVAGTAGVYKAVRFKTFSSAGVVDVLAAGGSVDLVLNADGTASGTMHIPEGALPGLPAQDVSLAGKWSIQNRDWVHLELPDAAAPLTAERFLVRQGQLLGTETVNEGTTNFNSFEIALARP